MAGFTIPYHTIPYLEVSEEAGDVILVSKRLNILSQHACFHCLAAYMAWSIKVTIISQSCH